MGNHKKAIILDMDETLESGRYRNKYDKNTDIIMILRPNLNILINKLQEVKKQGIDIILFTTARNEWVERFFKLKPEFKLLFNKKYTRDNKEKWLNYSKTKYPLEYNARKENINLEYSKPVTTLGYDSILFIDDNKIEETRLKILFEITHGKLEKDVTYFSGFRFNGGLIEYDKMLIYKKIANSNISFAKVLNQYIETERENPGCEFMCSVIDKFINKKFVSGLAIEDENYKGEYDKFREKITLLKEKIEKISSPLEEQISNIELKEYFESDKYYPYE